VAPSHTVVHRKTLWALQAVAGDQKLSLKNTRAKQRAIAGSVCDTKAQPLHQPSKQHWRDRSKERMEIEASYYV
jgi:hypothetical protein